MQKSLDTYNPSKCAQTRRNALRKEVKEHGLGEVILSLRMMMTTAYSNHSRIKNDVKWLHKTMKE
jgi:hypothetical protein